MSGRYRAAHDAAPSCANRGPDYEYFRAVYTSADRDLIADDGDRVRRTGHVAISAGRALAAGGFRCVEAGSSVSDGRRRLTGG